MSRIWTGLHGTAYTRRVKSALLPGKGNQMYTPAPVVGDWLTMRSLPDMTPKQRERYLYSFLSYWKGPHHVD